MLGILLNENINIFYKQDAYTPKGYINRAALYSIPILSGLALHDFSSYVDNDHPIIKYSSKIIGGSLVSLSSAGIINDLYNARQLVNDNTKYNKR